MQHVTSRHNPRIAAARKLAHSSRDRRKEQRCVLEGEHLIAVYRERVGPPETLIVADAALADASIAALARNVPPSNVLVASRAIFAEIVASSPDVGVLAIVPAPRSSAPSAPAFCLLLDDVQDPGNVGTMLRTAAAAGVGAVLLSKHCAFAWSPKVLRAAQGAHFLTTIAEDVDLPAWAAGFRARGGRVAALAPRGGVSLHQATLERPLALAVGNEGAGLSAALAAAADLRLTIPLPGGMESLNAAAAAAVALFECVRQWRSTDRRGSIQDR
jgi:TrmH family RNA methyltransferase